MLVWSKAKIIYLGISLFFCLFFLSATSWVRGEPKQSNIQKGKLIAVPYIARVGFVRVGVSTMEQLTKRLGKGLSVTGGHPHGAREWVSKQTGWYIYADGFDYKTTGRVVDSFEISNDYQDNIPRVSADPRKLYFLGSLAPGSSRSDVIALLKDRHLKTIITPNTITCVARGYMPVNREISYTTWTARLIFNRDKLKDIRIDCD